jgi:tetratricopeptide (TPR) repeat protein
LLEDHNKRDKSHLIRLIGRRSNSTPNFSLLIGAGASITSGVKTASEMISEWRRQLYDQSKSDKPIEEWLKEQDWYQNDEEYSILFEMVYDKRSQRRIYIEDCVKDAKPSWGYIYLSNLIAHKYFNIVFTPNFDDLLNEACFLYADLRPIVCAHDSAVADVRLTSARPKIIKLHGDFLYDTIKNTLKETETLEKNMRDKFIQFSCEYGLIVLGYGANDKSIMDILDILLKSDNYFPNGLYWCIRKGDKVNVKLERLLRRENIYWVQIDGFDEFMAELHKGLGLKLPDSVKDPYRATTERLNAFVSPRKDIEHPIIIEDVHPIIKEDIMELEKQIKKFERINEGPREELDRLVPYPLLGDMEFSRKTYKSYEAALSYYTKALVQEHGNLNILAKMIYAYVATEQFNEATGTAEKIIKQAPRNYMGYVLKGYSLTNMALSYPEKLNEAIAIYSEGLKYTAKEPAKRLLLLAFRANALLMAEKWTESLSDTEEALKIEPGDQSQIINKCIALKKLGRASEADRMLREILPKIKNKYFKSSVYAVLGDKKKMLKELEAAIREDVILRVDARRDPDFMDFRNDPDFQKLVYPKEHKKKMKSTNPLGATQS